MRELKTKIVMVYEKEYYELGEYDDLSKDDYLRLRFGWIRRIKKELKLKQTEFYIEKITQADLWNNYYNIIIYKYAELLTPSA